MVRAQLSKEEWLKLGEAAHYSVNELARLLQLSVRQLQRIFRRQFGRPPQEWLNAERIIAAQRLLLEGRSVKQTALDLNFKHTSHFCRQFKDTHDLTPSEFVLTQPQPGLQPNVAHV